jgi:hypothetical protein
LVFRLFVKLHPVKTVEEIFEALIEVEGVRTLATEAVLVSLTVGIVGISLPVGPSRSVILCSSLINFPQAKHQTANFLQTPFFELEFLRSLFAFIDANLKNNIFDEFDISAVHLVFLNLA